MLGLLERDLGLRNPPEIHVPGNQGIYRKKKHSSMSDILNRFSSFSVTEIRCNNLKKNCLSLLSAERRHFHSISEYCLAQDFAAVGVTFPGKEDSNPYTAFWNQFVRR